MATEGIDLVVTNYRTPGDLEAFLCSLEAHPPSCPWDLWICNVQPRDRDHCVGVNWAKKTNGHHVVFYSNVGYGRSCNYAAARGSREVVAFFNADVVLTENALDQCHEALLSHDDWGVLGPKQTDGNGFITHAGIFGTLEKPEHRGWHAHDDGQGFVDVRSDAISVSGSAYFVKRELWDRLCNCPLYREAIQSEGAFLPVTLFYEETWLSVHAISHSYQVVYYGPVSIVHKWHRAIRAAGVEEWAVRTMEESHEVFRSVCDHHGIAHD